MKDSVKVIKLLDNRCLTKSKRGGVKGFIHEGIFEQIISLENLFIAWQEFCKGKRNKSDVQVFELHLEDNIFSLHSDLIQGKYKCGFYQRFNINDPKPRIIHKAPVRDRLLHHAIHRVLYPIYDKTFVFDSYSCRKDKGAHKAFARLVQMARKISKTYTASCWALKCDIKKFFDSIDHQILIKLLRKRIEDCKLLNLLRQIIESFYVTPGKGLPLGNLTSQLLVNIYLDPLDKFIRHKLKARYYLRYADDILLLGPRRKQLLNYQRAIGCFLNDKLKLELHPIKTHLRKIFWGIDFVGYVALPHYNLPRPKTIKRIIKRSVNLSQNNFEVYKASLSSYLGYLKHVSGYRMAVILKSLVLQRAFKI